MTSVGRTVWSLVNRTRWEDPGMGTGEVGLTSGSLTYFQGTSYLCLLYVRSLAGLVKGSLSARSKIVVWAVTISGWYSCEYCEDDAFVKMTAQRSSKRDSQANLVSAIAYNVLFHIQVARVWKLSPHLR